MAAWRTKPSWALVATADQAINPEVERFGAQRAGATIVELEGASRCPAAPPAGQGVARRAGCGGSRRNRHDAEQLARGGMTSPVPR